MPISANRSVFNPLNLFSTFLGIVLLVVLLQQIDFEHLVGSLLAIQPEFLVLGGVAYLLKSIVRSIRFLYINERPTLEFFKMLRLTLASSLASQLLPLKLGELAYVFLVKKDFQARLSQGFSTLLVVRIFDLLTISLLFVLSALILQLPAGLSVYFYYILGFVAILLAFLGSLITASKLFPRLTLFPQQADPSRWFKILDKLQRGVQSVLLELGKFRGRQYIAMIGYSTVEWMLNYAMFHILLQGLRMAPKIFDTISAVTLAALASVLPINSFGNFGTQEAGWATGLVLLGHPQQSALTSGFATHLLTLSYMIILGGVAWISYLAGAVAHRKTACSDLNDH